MSADSAPRRGRSYVLYPFRSCDEDDDLMREKIREKHKEENKGIYKQSMNLWGWVSRPGSEVRPVNLKPSSARSDLLWQEVLNNITIAKAELPTPSILPC